MKSPKHFEPKKPKPKMWEIKEDPVRTVSSRNEQRLAGELGVGGVPGSGCMEWPSLKGDLTHPDILFEAKETKHTSIRVGASVVAKICKEATAVGKIPALILSAYGLPDPLPKDWVCVPAPLFSALLRSYDEGDHG